MGQKLGEAQPGLIDIHVGALKVEPVGVGDEAPDNVAGTPLVFGVVKLKEAEVVLEGAIGILMSISRNRKSHSAVFVLCSPARQDAAIRRGSSRIKKALH